APSVARAAETGMSSEWRDRKGQRSPWVPAPDANARHTELRASLPTGGDLSNCGTATKPLPDQPHHQQPTLCRLSPRETATRPPRARLDPNSRSDAAGLRVTSPGSAATPSLRGGATRLAHRERLHVPAVLAADLVERPA